MMEREDLARLADEALQRFEAPPARDAYRFGVLATSGTSGSGALIRIIEMERQPGSAYVEEWQKRDERILIAYGSLTTRLLQMLSLRKAGREARGIALDGADLKGGLQPLLEDLAAARLVGGPSFMLRIAEHLEERTKAKVASLRCAGERLSMPQRELLQKTFPQATVDVTYTSIETGTISKPLCGHLPLNQYHIRDTTEVSLSNEDAEGVGDILVSVPNDRIIPIREYRIGDIGKLHHEQCACGEKITLEVLGRKGIDYIKLAGALLRAEEFDRVARKLELFKDYRAEALDCIVEGKHKGKIVLRVYGMRAPQQEIAECFSRELFLTPTRTLFNLVEDELFLPLEVIQSEKPFSTSNKEIKLHYRK